MNSDILYPEVYEKFAPIADQLIRDMEKQHGDIILNEDLLRQMIDEAIRRTELETSADMPTEEAVSVLYQVGRRPNNHSNRQHNHGGGSHGHHHGHWSSYNHGALNDIFRILFLQQLFGRRRPNWRVR